MAGKGASPTCNGQCSDMEVRQKPKFQADSCFRGHRDVFGYAGHNLARGPPGARARSASSAPPPCVVAMLCWGADWVSLPSLWVPTSAFPGRIAALVPALPVELARPSCGWGV